MAKTIPILQPLIKPEEKKLSKSDIEIIIELLISDPEQSKRFFQLVSMAMRALEGQPVEPQDVYSGMLNIKNIRERTRFMTRLDLRRHIYLRFLSLIWPETSHVWDGWSNEEAWNFISYPRGEGRKEGVEIMKAKGMIAQGMQPIFLGEMPRPLEKQPGRLQRWFGGKKKTGEEIVE